MASNQLQVCWGCLQRTIPAFYLCCSSHQNLIVNFDRVVMILTFWHTLSCRYVEWVSTNYRAAFYLCCCSSHQNLTVNFDRVVIILTPSSCRYVGVSTNYRRFYFCCSSHRNLTVNFGRVVTIIPTFWQLLHPPDLVSMSRLAAAVLPRFPSSAREKGSLSSSLLRS